MNQSMYKHDKKLGKKVKSNIFYYCEAERAIIKCAALEKRPILLSHFTLLHPI